MWIGISAMQSKTRLYKVFFMQFSGRSLTKSHLISFFLIIDSKFQVLKNELAPVVVAEFFFPLTYHYLTNIWLFDNQFEINIQSLVTIVVTFCHSLSKPDRYYVQLILSQMPLKESYEKFTEIACKHSWNSEFDLKRNRKAAPIKKCQMSLTCDFPLINTKKTHPFSIFI